MDPNNIKNTTTNGCWDLDMNMGMGNHPLHLNQELHMDLFHNMDQSQQATPLPPPNPLTTIPQLGPPNEARSFEKINYEVNVGEEEEEGERLGAMKEMMYKIAAMQPVDIDPATIRKPKRRNVRISDDPQSIAARHRRERISERIRILQRLVPGGTKMDTASMLDEAIRYVKFLKREVHQLQAHGQQSPLGAQLGTSSGWPVRTTDGVGPSSMSAGGGSGSGLGFGFSFGDGSSYP